MTTTVYDLSCMPCCDGGGGDVVDFCGCSNVPTTLHADFVHGSFSQTVTLNYDSGSSTYVGTLTCEDCSFSVTLACVSSTLELTIGTIAGPADCALCLQTGTTSPACDPFEATFSLPIIDSAGCNAVCGDGTTWEIDIYE